MTSAETMTNSQRRKAKHDEHHLKRHIRFESGVFGKILDPVIPTGEPVCFDPPSYTKSHRTALKDNPRTGRAKRDSIYRNMSDADLKLDMRCFYTGIVCARTIVGDGRRDAYAQPWLGTRDHMVPARRYIDCPVDVAKFRNTYVWCSSIANVTFGMVPLSVRLKIRQWLMTTRYDRSDTSLEAGNNIRWIIINMLREFRVGDRFLWSRDMKSDWWNPSFSEPFMQRMWATELEFLRMSEDDRNEFVRTFNWQF